MAINELIVPVDMSYLGFLGVRGIEHTLTLIREQLEHPIERNLFIGSNQ